MEAEVEVDEVGVEDSVAGESEADFLVAAVEVGVEVPEIKLPLIFFHNPL